MTNTAETAHHTDIDETQNEAIMPESTIGQQFHLIDRKCFKDNLAEYLTKHPETSFTAEEITTAVKDLIEEKTVSPEMLSFLREHAGEFYTQTKQKPRHATIPANMGVTQWANNYRDSVRAVFGKIDPIIALDTKLKDRLPNFDLKERVSVRADQLAELATMLGLSPEDGNAMKQELIEMVRVASLPYTQNTEIEINGKKINTGYEKLKRLAKDMASINVKSIGVDFSEILAKYWHPSTEEMQMLLANDFKETKYLKQYPEGTPIQEKVEGEMREVIRFYKEMDHSEALENNMRDTSSEGYRTILLLAALRKTFGTIDAMAPINHFGTLDINETPIFKRQKSDEKIFFYNIEDGLLEIKKEKVNAEGKKETTTSFNYTQGGKLHMQSLSQWLSITFARLMNNQKKAEEERTIHDGMTGGRPYNYHGPQAPNFDKRFIARL